jgi:hypothetical protein
MLTRGIAATITMKKSVLSLFFKAVQCTAAEALVKRMAATGCTLLDIFCFLSSSHTICNVNKQMRRHEHKRSVNVDTKKVSGGK